MPARSSDGAENTLLLLSEAVGRQHTSELKLPVHTAPQCAITEAAPSCPTSDWLGALGRWHLRVNPVLQTIKTLEFSLFSAFCFLL